MRQAGVQLGDLLFLQRDMARDAELRAHVEQIVLDGQQVGGHVRGQGFGKQQADDAVQFIHVAQGGDAGRVLGHAGSVPKPGGAVVSGAGGNDG
ncbi:hypothetical protein D3C72_2230810 [compost metagenome]